VADGTVSADGFGYGIFAPAPEDVTEQVAPHRAPRGT
jgi:hypothetical protein